MTDAGVADRATRRELLGALSVCCTAAGLGGCGRNARRAGQRGTHIKETADRDTELLNGLLDLEFEVIAAYTAAIPLLSGRARKAAQRFLGHELSHAGELGGLIRQAKGKAHSPRSAYDLGRPTGVKGVLELLHGLERRELNLKLAAVPELSLGSTRAAVSAVLGSDAQHLSVLSASLGLDPLPSAFPGG